MSLLKLGKSQAARHLYKYVVVEEISILCSGRGLNLEACAIQKHRIQKLKTITNCWLGSS